MATVLIVEDEAFIRLNAGWTIEDLGHDILLAGDLDEALVHLSASGHIHGLFVDIRLNTLAYGGYDVANQAIGFWPELRVLYTSGSFLTNDMANLFVSGGQFLQKPYSPTQLETSLSALLC